MKDLDSAERLANIYSLLVNTEAFTSNSGRTDLNAEVGALRHAVGEQLMQVVRPEVLVVPAPRQEQTPWC